VAGISRPHFKRGIKPYDTPGVLRTRGENHMTTLHSLGPTPKNLILAHIYPLRRLAMLVHNVPSTLQETASFLTSPTICSIPKNRMQHTRFEYTVNLPKSQGNAGYIAKPITHSDCIKATISKRQI